MKSKTFRTGLALGIAVLLTGIVSAQRPKRPSRNVTTPVSPPQPVTITGPNLNGIPIIMDSSAIADTVRPSLKPTNPFGPNDKDKRIPLPYENLRWDDALYVQKVWRELDLREKMNQAFRYDAIDDKGSQVFSNMLLEAVKSGQVMAFRDDRFSIPVTANEVIEMTQGKLDTVPRYDPAKGTIDAYIVTRESFDPKTVMRLRVMEEWVFDRESSRLFCRILGIAPVKTVTIGNKEFPSIMFWVSYPDLRPMLANAEVYNPKNMGQSQMTWEELFESRMFSSYITKSTMDNPGNKAIRTYIKDPVLALLEGDKIKDRIFNYEQDLWSY